MNVAGFLVVMEAAGGGYWIRQRGMENVGTQRNAGSHAGASYT